jgi:serine protease
MKKKLFFLLLLFAVLVLINGCEGDFSGSGILRGTVYLDGGSGQPLNNARIYLNGVQRSTTNEDGEFRITGLNQDAVYDLRVSKDNFRDYYRNDVRTTDSPFYIPLMLADSSKTYISGRVNFNNKTGFDQDYFFNNLAADSVNWKVDDSQEYNEDEIIVKYKDDQAVQALSQDSALSMLQSTAEIRSSEFSDSKVVKYKLASGQTVEQMIAYFEDIPGVEYAEPNYKVYAQAQPNDSYYREGKQWNLINANLEAAWDRQRYSDSIVVAVIDSGVLPEHPDLEPNLLNGANFVGDSSSSDDPANYSPTNFDVLERSSESDGGSHGTVMAGIIGAVSNNNRGVAGVSWGVNIIPIKALNGTSGDAFDVAEAIYYAVDRGADIINLSLGYNYNGSYMREAVEAAAAENVIIVAAAGNNGGSVLYPAAYPEVIAVGAHDSSYKLADYSASGSYLDLTAPGGDKSSPIFSTWGYYNNGQTYHDYRSTTGTSVAAAHVSGAAALLLESGLSSWNVRQRLVNYTNTMFADYNSSEYGQGALDVYAALLGRDLGPVRVYLSEDDNRFGILVDAKLESNGEFELVENIEPGYYYLTAHRDAGGSSTSQVGDYFGVSERIYLRNGEYYNVEIEMYYVTD